MKEALARQRGMALVMVLWVISLMTIMAGSFALSTQREAGILSHAHERAKALAMADAGINYAMLMLSIPDPKKRWQSDGRPYLWQANGGKVRLSIIDEGGKVDVNVAQEQTLKAVLKLALQNEEQATQLTDAIIDWRDADDIKRNMGAEAEDYKAKGMKALPQNRNFMVMDELRGVMGLSPDLYRKLENWFTLYSGSDGLNTQKASKEVLTALLGGDERAVANFMQQRQLGAPAPLPPIPGINTSGSSDMAYSVIAESEIDDHQVFGVLATIRRGPGANGSPFTMLRWKPYHVRPKSNPTHSP
ncbi:MAG: general secretion pathway protein GspK [Gammaproteobacteria bacterium]|nr:general secretion pathway protein GspK [Gammaproteobacteria bacterium]NBY22188.1 general secretion pathway protein GspK [Gammaproteobacteria bacterium]NDE57400.1 general secretion pathway protein GspK [Gammaproteobacteria bacterium]